MVETSFTPSIVFSDSLRDGNLNITWHNGKYVEKYMGKDRSPVEYNSRSIRLSLRHRVNSPHVRPPRRSFPRVSFLEISCPLAMTTTYFVADKISRKIILLCKAVNIL